MLDFIVTYWLEFLFGLIAALVTFLIKQYYSLQKKVHNQQRDNFEEEIIEAINNSLKKEQEKTNKEIASAKEEILKVHKSTDILKTGLLNVQRKNFMEFCYLLLEPDHIITKEEYENIEEDHDVYNALDGNHKGDELFRVVSEKYFNQFNK